MSVCSFEENKCPSAPLMSLMLDPISLELFQKGFGDHISSIDSSILSLSCVSQNAALRPQVQECDLFPFSSHFMCSWREP